MKRRSVDFLDLVWEKTKINGLIIIDDVIKFSEKMKGLKEFLEKNKINYNIIPIDVDDGIMMIIKEKENLDFRWEKDYSKEQVRDNVKK
jgi:NADPH-dependent curcumin reductase CurA